LDDGPVTPEEPSADAPERDPAPRPAGAGYRVELDAYAGPLDLLLYLIRKEEVDVYDIPIARITEQYGQHLDLLSELNVNVAGEFLVMAATLMEIKSRMLLPREEGLEEEEEDPRAELVRQLLEYKRYKDLARELGARATEQARKFPRPAGAAPVEAPEGEAAPDGGLEGIGLWELIEAFAKVLSETSIGPPETQVLERERPIQEFRRKLLQIVTEEPGLTFSRIFAGCVSRDEMMAMFVALLELVRLRRVRLQQSAEFRELYLHPAGPDEPPEPARAAEPPAAAGAAEPSGAAAKRPELLKSVDVLAELEQEEAETLGRARGRIDAAIRRTEAFLRRHHEQARREGGADEAPPPEAPPADDDSTPPE